MTQQRTAGTPLDTAALDTAAALTGDASRSLPPWRRGERR
jgi:hypothetical protein